MTFLVFLGRFLDASNKKRVEIRLWCVCVWLPCFPSGPIGSILGPKKITFGRHELLGLGNFSTSLLHVSAWAFLEDVFSDMPCRSMGVSVGGSELAVVSALQWSIVVFFVARWWLRFCLCERLFGWLLRSSEWGFWAALKECVPLPWVLLAVVSGLLHTSRFVWDVSGGLLTLALVAGFACV